VDETNKSRLPSVEESKKTNFSLITNSHSSINPPNLVKIGLAEFEIIGLTEIVKNKIFKNK